MNDTGRESPAYWQVRINESRERNQRGLDDFERYSRWLAGDMRDVSARLENDYGIHGAIESNLLGLVVRQGLAEMFYRSPRALVKPTEIIRKSALEAIEGLTSDPNLRAQVETYLLNDWIEEAGLFRTGRRVLTDGLCGPIMVLKTGYSADISIDHDRVMEERTAAKSALKGLLLKRRYKVKKEMHHGVWIEELEQFQRRIFDGTIQNLHVNLVGWVKDSLETHRNYEALGVARPGETIRRDGIFCRRIPPHCYFRDPYADTPSGREWVGEATLWRREDVMNNPHFDKRAKGELTSTRDPRWMPESDYGSTPGLEPDEDDDRVLLFEIIDLVAGKVLIFGEGATRMLQVKDYKDQDILPSGPYVEAAFLEDPLTDQGISPPRAYESHQVALSLTDGIITETALRSMPRLAVAADMIGEDELDALNSSRLVARTIPLRNLTVDSDIRKMIAPIPTSDVPKVTLQARAIHESAIQQLSGQGSQKLLGGDSSDTATEAAIVGSSASNLSEDRAAVADDLFSRMLRNVLRLMRRYYTVERVAEIVGDVAYDVWPARQMEAREIRMDKNAMVVPGSSRRKNTAVEQNQMLKALGLALQLPTLPPAAGIELLKRAFESMDITGIDFSGMDTFLPGNGQAEAINRQTGETEGMSDSGLAQGAANPAAGRAGSSVQSKVGQVRRQEAEKAKSSAPQS